MRTFSILLGSFVSLHLISSGQVDTSSSTIEQSNFITDFETSEGASTPSETNQHTEPSTKRVKNKRTTRPAKGNLPTEKNVNNSSGFVSAHPSPELPETTSTAPARKRKKIPKTVAHTPTPQDLTENGTISVETKNIHTQSEFETSSTRFSRMLFETTTPKLLDLIEAATADGHMKKQGRPVKRKDELFKEVAGGDDSDVPILLEHDDDAPGESLSKEDIDELETSSEEIKLSRRPKLPKLSQTAKKRIARREKKRNLKKQKRKSDISNEHEEFLGKKPELDEGNTLWWQRNENAITTASNVDRTSELDSSSREVEHQNEEVRSPEQLQEASPGQNEETRSSEQLQEESLGQNEGARTFWWEKDNTTQVNISSSEHERLQQEKTKRADERKKLRRERDNTSISNETVQPNRVKKKKLPVFQEGVGWVDDQNDLKKILEASDSAEDDDGNAKRRGFDRSHSGEEDGRGQGLRKDSRGGRGSDRADRNDRQGTSKIWRSDRGYDNDRRRESRYSGADARNDRRPDWRNDRYRNDGRNGRYDRSYERSGFGRGGRNRGGSGEYRGSNYRRDDDRRGDGGNRGSQYGRDDDRRGDDRGNRGSQYGRDDDKRGDRGNRGSQYGRNDDRRGDDRGNIGSQHGRDDDRRGDRGNRGSQYRRDDDRRDGGKYRESNFRDRDVRRDNRKDSSEYRESKPRRDDDRRNSDGYRESKYRGDGGRNNRKFDDRGSGQDQRPQKGIKY